MGSTKSQTIAPVMEKLAYTGAEFEALTGLSAVTRYRLEQRGLLKAVPGLRHKLYTREAVMLFLRGETNTENNVTASTRRAGREAPTVAPAPAGATKTRSMPPLPDPRANRFITD